MISFTPIFDRVLIKRHDSALQKKTSKVGLVLPDSVGDKYKSSMGTLVQCGQDCHEDVKSLLGKSVLFARYSGDEIKLNDEEFLLATDRDIFGGIDDTDATAE
jgi:chaperonin GroES